MGQAKAQYWVMSVKNKTQKHWVQDRSKMLLLMLIKLFKVLMLSWIHNFNANNALKTWNAIYAPKTDTNWYDSAIMLKLVTNPLIWINTILKSCWNLSWILWYELIRFYNHVETCPESSDTNWYDSTIIIITMMWFDTILKHV